MRKKHFILALQPHEANPLLSPGARHRSIALALTLLLLMGLAFPITTPSEWQERVRVGLLRHAYGWQTSPLISAQEAGGLYSSWFNKVPKNGCNDAQERDWQIICPLISSQMSYGLDCANANQASKKEILRNFETSRTTKMYACLYVGV